ncbi:MAG: putative major head protein [Prokaryotic dsDNA virus sp.]|nr:MAG: putative major head protein [Prokaryotic dsDNA virus sp.]|tara:strand:+ start:6314 stop:7348 length:1035 start_codon:yes stop_codon:yes gene_type:complete
MATGVPTLSETLNTEFTHTWYEIRPEAIDNILDATPVTALLRAKNRFKSQNGGRFIERTVLYGEKTASGFVKGDVLPVEEPDLETVALFNWGYTQVPVTRTFVDDQVNSGPEKIKDYVDTRLTAARNALVQKIEAVIMAEATWTAASKDPLSIYDYIPDNGDGTNRFVSGSSTTYGGIDQENPWWQNQDYTIAAGSENQYGTKTGPASSTMYDDMRNVFNTTGAQLSNPDCIITTQSLFEIFEDFAVQKEQIIRDETTRLADLGYDVLRFRGKPITWSSRTKASQMIFLNSEFFDIVFDPKAWFDMTDWQRPSRQLEQVAYIILAWQILGYNKRFNARVEWDSE